VKVSRQSYKLASFLSHIHSLLLQSNKNFVPTKRQSYHTFPPPLRCWHENTRLLFNMQLYSTQSVLSSQPHLMWSTIYNAINTALTTTTVTKVMVLVNVVPIGFCRHVMDGISRFTCHVVFFLFFSPQPVILLFMKIQVF
jgi:hypothetical protein